MANQQPGIMARLRAAWDVARYGYPLDRVPVAGKSAPFLFPLWRSGNPQWQIIDYSAYVREGFNINTLIYSAIMYKVRSSGIAPLRAYTGSREHPELLPPSHPLAQLVARPSPNGSMTELQGLNEVYLNLSGNSYTMIDRGADNAIVALYALRPDRVFIVPDDGKIKGFYYVPEGRAYNDGVPILPQDMIHVKLPNPLDPLEGMGYGLSPLSSLARSADVDNHITSFLKIFFEQGTMVNGILKYDVPMDDVQINRAKKRWQEMYGGYSNWDEIGVIDQGGSYQQVGMTFEEMGFEKLDERNESRLLGPFGVPAILIGSRIGLMRSTYANYKEARAAFWEDTMVPELMLFEHDYQYYLQTDDDAFVAFDLTNVPALRKDISTLVEAWATLVDRGVPKYNAAEVVGLDLGDLPDGKVVYMPLSLVPMGSSDTGDNESDAGAVEATDDTRQTGKDTIPPITPIVVPTTPIKLLPPSNGSSNGKKKVASRQFTAEQRLGHWKAIDMLARKWERQFGNAAKKQFETERRSILALLGKALAGSYRQKATINWADEAVDVNEYLASAGENWRSAFVPLMQGVMTEQGQRWAIELGMAFDVRNFFAEEWFKEYTLRFAQPINDTTTEGLASLFAQAQAEGWSVPTMQGHITAMFEQWMNGDKTAEDFDWYAERLPPFRTETIARTETMRSSNAGTYNLFTDWGIGSKEWLATMDDRVRDGHMAANGQIVPMTDAFIVDSEELQYPLDPNGSLENTINCRCTTLPVI